jgi:hypothetical protein
MDGAFNVHMKTRNAYKICVGKPEGRCHFGDGSVDGMWRV